MKKLFSIAVSLLLILSFSVFAFAYENTVDDSAALFTDEEAEEILTQAEEYTDLTGYSLAIVTTDYAGGYTSEEYADNYHDNLIDSEGWSENSILFLIDTDNGEVYISTTGDAIFTYDDYTVDYIIDSGFDELSYGNYSQAVLLMIEAAQDEFEYSESDDGIIEEHYYYFPEDTYEDDYYYESNSFEFSDCLSYVVIGLVIAAVSVLAVKSRYKNFGKGEEFDEDDIILNLTGSNDSVISRNVTTTRIPKNNNYNGRPGGGVHGGGGTSVHHSSAGRSHGGGGRSFR